MPEETARQKVENLLEMMGDLPPMPEVATKVLEVANSEDARVSDVTRLIASDPGLATKVLGTCNSAYYGLPQRVKTLSRAVGLLGFKTVRNLVLVHSLPFNRSGVPGFAEKVIWSHAGGTAVAARILASEVGGVDAEEALLGGLIHDAGRLALNLIMPEKYEKVLLKIYNREGDSTAIETDLLGFDHTLAGQLVMRKWGLPDSLVSIVRDHHNPIEELDPPVLIVRAADEVSWILGQGVKAEEESMSELPPALTALGFTLESFDKLEEKVSVGMEQSRDIFG